MGTTRRYTIHPPQLVGRISPAQRGEEVEKAIRRLIGEYDGAMQELQRFLRYMMDASETSQTGEGIELVEGGKVSLTASDVAFVPVGTISAVDVQGAIVEVAAEADTFGAMMSRLSLGF